MKRRRTATAIVMVVLFLGFDSHAAFADSHGNGSGAPASGGGAAPRSGGSTGARLSYSGGPRSYGGQRFYAGPRYHPGIYRPAVVYGSAGRTFYYPSVHGTITPIYSNVNRGNHVSATQYKSLHQHFTAQHHQIATGLTSSNLRTGNSSQNNLAAKSRLRPQTSARLRNWNGKIDSATEARRNHEEFRHDHHDRDWWRRHCAAIVFFDLGWWGWYDGWWYPAWGYAPYDYYAYDQPIYGYDGLPPGQVVANVQSALQELGYFSYAVDGKMGPLTRAAIANYQRDHLLPITGYIDPATLGSLGITD